MGGSVNEWMGGRMSRWTCGWGVGRWMEAQTVGWTHRNGRTDGGIDARGLRGGDEDFTDPI